MFQFPILNLSDILNSPLDIQYLDNLYSSYKIGETSSSYSSGGETSSSYSSGGETSSSYSSRGKTGNSSVNVTEYILKKLIENKNYESIKHLILKYNAEPYMNYVHEAIANNDIQLLKAIYVKVNPQNRKQFEYSKYDSLYYYALSKKNKEIINFMKSKGFKE